MKKNFTQKCLTLILFNLTLPLLSQQWQWARGISLPYLPYTSEVHVTTESTGNFYLSCAQWDQNNGWPAGSCIVKYDANGNELWRRMFSEKYGFIKSRQTITVTY